ncbi:MAG: GNAT family N-acetyltransferase [Eubacterium sp.]|nr:GNAT family N-acetyltransferase [Eubacterium sp.]
MIRIRYAKYEDYELILKIDNSISQNKWKTWTDNRQAIFAFEDDIFLGWLQYNYFIEKYPFINRLYIFEKYQNNGAGTTLIQFWENEMKNKGETRLMLSTESDNYGARRLYERLGFKCVGELNLRPQNQELVMLKEI